jgi:hypothetical protein
MEMGAQKVNQPTLKMLKLKRLAKQKKKGVGTGDGGLISIKQLK